MVGADHEGIIHQIAQGLSQRGINIESMDTGTDEAPVSGTPLFSMSGVVLVPPHLAEDDWIGALAEAGDKANVDIEVVRRRLAADDRELAQAPSTTTSSSADERSVRGSIRSRPSLTRATIAGSAPVRSCSSSSATW